MKEIFLVVIFIVNGEIQIIDGFNPLPMESKEYCETRKEFALDYIPNIPNIPELEGVYCGTKDEIQQIITNINNDVI